MLEEDLLSMADASQRKPMFSMSRIHRPPPLGEYSELSPHTQGQPGTPGTPELRLHQDNSADHTPLASPDPHGHDNFSRQDRPESSRTMLNFPPDIEIQSLIHQRSHMMSHWGLHWWTPFCMVSLFVLGVVGALVHHGFYRGLDGQEAKDQLTRVRIGTGMAFFTKVCLVGSVVLSYKQRIWYSLRRKGMTVSAIDGLFAVIEDPSQFRKWEMLTGAKLAALMALAVWTMPLAAVFSPSTLTSTLGAMAAQGTCSRVPNLNFTAETDMNYRVARIVNGGLGISLAYYNTTDPAGSAPGFFDYFDQPSKNAERVTTISAFMKKAVEKDTANVQACGNGTLNCTYSITFDGPGYKCDELASGVGSSVAELAAIGAPFNTSSLVPEGVNIYQAVVKLGEYAPVQTLTDENGVPIPPYPDDLGVFKTEPVLWIGHSINTGKPLAPGSPFSTRWDTEHIPKIFSCTHYETSYRAQFNFTGGQQNINVSREFQSPIINTTLTLTTSGTINESVAMPMENWVRPTGDVGRYKRTAAYHALGLLLRRQLQGTIDLLNGQPRTKTDASATRLVNQTNFYPVEDLQEQVQSFYEEMILSLLSDPQLIVATTASVPCTRSRRVSVFKYVPSGLWIGYAISIAVTLIFLLVGIHAMYANGVSSDTVFSRIMTTTRNPTLDRLSVGACLGSDPFPKELERTKLRFGVLDEDAGERGGRRESNDMWICGEKVGHCTFGTEVQIGDIVKGRNYAGLRRRWKGWE